MLNPREALKTSWVYSLRKDDLVSYLLQCAQDTSGTVEEMRRRLAKFVNTDHDEKLSEKLLTWQRHHEQSDASSPKVHLTTPVDEHDDEKTLSCEKNLPNVDTEPKLKDNDRGRKCDDRVATIEVIRKWGLKYDGGKDVLNFVDRLEELSGMYGIDPSDVIPVMFELLRGKALVWFRSNQKPWALWQQFKRDFLDFFLPPRYFEKLEDEIRRRTQRQRESFKDYLLSMQDLMYHSRLNAKEQLEIIFRNSLPDYQWYIRRKDFANLDDLLTLAADLESIPSPNHAGRNEQHRMLTNPPSRPRSQRSHTSEKGTPATYLAWKGKLNVVADALSRQPIAEINLAQAQQADLCPWYEGKLEAVQKSPEHYSDYAVINNLLYRHLEREINDEDSTPWKLCVPTSQRRQVLQETHDRATGGHLGVRKTLSKAAGRYYWPGMARDISRYVRQCKVCQEYKVSQQQPAGKMLTRIQSEPWSLIGADFVGPLPRTKHGNTMLLVLFDSFSKWVELIPVRKATGEGVVKALRERIIARYGVPKAIITDNGTQFTSNILKKYLKDIGVQQQFTAPYTPQENPTERVNRTIKTIIAQFSGEGHNR